MGYANKRAERVEEPSPLTKHAGGGLVLTGFGRALDRRSFPDSEHSAPLFAAEQGQRYLLYTSITYRYRVQRCRLTSPAATPESGVARAGPPETGSIDTPLLTNLLRSRSRWHQTRNEINRLHPPRPQRSRPRRTRPPQTLPSRSNRSMSSTAKVSENQQRCRHNPLNIVSMLLPA